MPDGRSKRVLGSGTSGSGLILPRRRLLKGAGATAMAGTAAVAMPRYVYSQQREDHPLAGQTIDMTILGIAGWLPSSLGVQMSPLFTEYAQERFGYTAEFSFADAPFSGLFQKAATSLATRSQEYNIIISDSQWLGALASPGWIIQLNDVIAQNPNLDIEWYGPVVPNTYMIYPDGTDQIWGLPQEGDTIALFVRKDLIHNEDERRAFRERYNAELPQTFEDFEELTMTEFEKVAEFFTRPEDEIWGTAMQYSREYDFCSCYLYPFMFSQGGDIWNPETGQVEGILNSDINAMAMEQMKHWLRYQPPGAVNYGIAEQIDVFTQGKVATCFQWAAVGLAMITDDMRDQVMVVAPPKHGEGDAADRIYTMGGQPWVVNAFNDDAHMRVAIDFLNWWYLPEVQLEFARRGGNPCGLETLNSAGFDDLQPWFRAFKFMLEGTRSRDFWHHPKYAEMLSLQQEAFTSFMTGQTADAMQALNVAACGQQQILFDYGTASEGPSRACRGVSL